MKLSAKPLSTQLHARVVTRLRPYTCMSGERSLSSNFSLHLSTCCSIHTFVARCCLEILLLAALALGQTYSLHELFILCYFELCCW